MKPSHEPCRTNLGPQARELGRVADPSKAGRLFRMLPPWLLTWLIYSLAFWLTALVLPGFKVDGFVGAIVSAGLFGLLNWLLGTFLFYLLGFATLGIGLVLGFLTRWVVNAILLKIASALSDRLDIRSFGIAFIAGLMITVLSEIAKQVLLHHPTSAGRMIWV